MGQHFLHKILFYFFRFMKSGWGLKRKRERSKSIFAMRSKDFFLIRFSSSFFVQGKNFKNYGLAWNMSYDPDGGAGRDLDVLVIAAHQGSVLMSLIFAQHLTVICKVVTRIELLEQFYNHVSEWDGWTQTALSFSLLHLIMLLTKYFQIRYGNQWN